MEMFLRGNFRTSRSILLFFNYFFIFLFIKPLKYLIYKENMTNIYNLFNA